MRLEIQDVPPSLNKVLRMHWRKKYALTQCWIQWVLLKRPRIHLKPFVKMRLRIVLAHSRPYDKDNAYGACKPVIDALKVWKLIYDDTAEYLDLTVEQQKCSHKKRHTVIELEAA